MQFVQLKKSLYIVRFMVQKVSIYKIEEKFSENMTNRGSPFVRIDN